MLAKPIKKLKTFVLSRRDDVHLVFAKSFEDTELASRISRPVAISDSKNFRHNILNSLIVVDLRFFCESDTVLLEDLVANNLVLLVVDENDRSTASELMTRGLDDYVVHTELNSILAAQTLLKIVARSYARKSENAELNNETLLSKVFEATVDPMLVLDSNYKIKFLNKAAATLLEAGKQDLKGEVFPFSFESGEVSELEIPDREGRIQTLELSLTDIIWNNSEARIIVLRNITRQTSVRDELSRTHLWYKSLLDATPAPVAAIDKAGTLLAVNQLAKTILEGSDILESNRVDPQRVRVASSPSDSAVYENFSELSKRQELNQNKNNQVLITIDDPLADLPNAKLTSFESQSSRDYLLLFDAQGSDQPEATGNLLGNDSEILQVLASGIAHDLNNLLSAVLGNVSIIQQQTSSDDPYSGKLKAIESATMQARSLTQQMLTFAKGGSFQIESADIAGMVKECADFMIRGSNVNYAMRVKDTPWPVDVDHGQICQVINNLIVNADQAMQNGGTIDIVIENVIVEAGSIEALKGGDYVVLSFSDEGQGIESSLLKKIFDPYFTTKKSGNGLGLASCAAIIEAHDGCILAQSTVGKGSTFSIYLPRGEDVSAETTVDSASKNLADSVVISELSDPSARKRILVMDDMEAMKLVAGEILALLGYDVSYASDGKEAIQAYKNAKENGERFDAVVFDLTVPGGMGGEEAATILATYDPSLVAIASSGYTTSNVMTDYKNSPFTAVVPKPYRIKEMSDTLQRILK